MLALFTKIAQLWGAKATKHPTACLMMATHSLRQEV